VEVKTGEEVEEQVFKMRAKLFKFDPESKEWKERGTGDVRLLKHKENLKTRLVPGDEKQIADKVWVMRTEGVYAKILRRDGRAP